MSPSGAVEKSEGDEAALRGGELLYCGGTIWENMGRRTAAAESNLVSPTRLRTFVGVDIRFVASGCSSCHCVALDVGGRCYTWGRNEKSQLGHGDTLNRNLPTFVHGLSKHKIVSAATGRNHTVVITDDGKSFSFGFNKHGQLGTGSTRNEIEAFPVASSVSEVTTAACGADFTVWLSSVEGSSILTAGLPQYGQLGHGTDNEYNTKESSVKLAYEPQSRPRAIASLSGKTITKVACGTNHTVAVDSDGFVYTWGFGGYGRLGHREPKDEWVPRLVEVFQRKNVLPHDAVISAGSVNSACTGGGGQLYMWGKLKTTGDEWMYPKPVLDLSGWNIRCMASGNMHHVIGADDSCISWGHAQYGELGYGQLGPKTSTIPKKVDSLEGMHVKRENIGDLLDKLEVYDGETAEGTEDDNSGAIRNQTNKREVKSASTKRKQEDTSKEDDHGDPDSDDHEDESNDEPDSRKSKRRGKPSSRGRGKGAKKIASEAKNSGRGRGRPKSVSKGSSDCGGKKGKSR
ncbi:protein RCC2 isoform X2 [Phalaenopsis equestris]|uniref:protein RCC2 isoform X2 n=1 Tax=Phalaenopsis equestris TaxID=78828 RepID=UPI0009E3C903|nr:protein RCC2 isoform X2 [Phalaenopsis equestris]